MKVKHNKNMAFAVAAFLLMVEEGSERLKRRTLRHLSNSLELPEPASGSIEGISPTSSGPNLIAALSSNDAASVGTWKLIKGKVSQTIEDIKSSKSSSQNIPIPGSKGDAQQEPDSDQDYATVNSSISEDLPLEREHRSRHHHQQQQQSAKADSDSSLDNESLLEGDVERSRLRRGLANLKSKVKAKSHHHHHHHQSQHPHQSSHSVTPGLATAALSTATISTAFGTAAIKPSMQKEVKESVELTTSRLPTSSSSSMFLRKRPKHEVETGEAASTSPVEETPVEKSKQERKKKEKGIISGKKDVEIESGVEMLEDTLPFAQASSLLYMDTTESSTFAMKRSREPTHLGLGPNLHETDESLLSPAYGTTDASDFGAAPASPGGLSGLSLRLALTYRSVLKRTPIVSVILLLLVLFLPLHDFIRGVLSCLLAIAIVESVTTVLQELLEHYMVTNPPEKSSFKIPDYSKMNILEIPAVEEHKTIKSYSGWMNEANSYDPNNFHISMTKSVFVTLEGSMLRVSATTKRIPKKIMWNEPHFDQKLVDYIDHRQFDLLGSRIELLPLGLAKKRFFNRKYPIQLIIKKSAIYLETDSNNSLVVMKIDSLESQKVEKDWEVIPESKEYKKQHHHDKHREKHHEKGGEKQQEQEKQEKQHEKNSVSESSLESDQKLNFVATVLNADLQTLQDSVNPDEDLKAITMPTGDETRLLLFSRGDREKEDWYRRFCAASKGEVHDQELHLPNIKFIHDMDLQRTAANSAIRLLTPKYKESTSASTFPQSPHSSQASDINSKPVSQIDENSKATLLLSGPPSTTESKSADKKSNNRAQFSTPLDESFKDIVDDDLELENELETDTSFEGLIMNSNAGRNPADYINFMSLYQKACKLEHIPVFKRVKVRIEERTDRRRRRRSKQQEDDLWKGIDQTLFLGPSGSVVWLNVLLGRGMFSCLHNMNLQEKIKEFLQKKLNSIKLPSFMEDVVITNIHLGEKPPLIHRVSQPMLDERGTWVDADITYEGLAHITVTTKLNLMRMKRQSRQPIVVETAAMFHASPMPPINLPDILAVPSSSSLTSDDMPMLDALSSSAIFDSDAESSGASSSDTESPIGSRQGEQAATGTAGVYESGNARRIFKLVDRFTASNFFQYATELSYVQRAMENMSTNIKLRVELKGLVGRGVMNIPPPPSDRVWLAFRGPPRLWISAKPAVGDKTVDWSIVTNIIESKLCEEVNKFLVYPNMVDLTIPYLGYPSYESDDI